MDLVKGKEIFFARIMPGLGIYELYDLKVRTVCEDWFTGYDKKTSHVFYFRKSDLGESVFTERGEALKKVKEAEEMKE